MMADSSDGLEQRDGDRVTADYDGLRAGGLNAGHSFTVGVDASSSRAGQRARRVLPRCYKGI